MYDFHSLTLIPSTSILSPSTTNPSPNPYPESMPVPAPLHLYTRPLHYIPTLYPYTTPLHPSAVVRTATSAALAFLSTSLPVIVLTPPGCDDCSTSGNSSSCSLMSTTTNGISTGIATLTSKGLQSEEIVEMPLLHETLTSLWQYVRETNRIPQPPFKVPWREGGVSPCACLYVRSNGPVCNSSSITTATTAITSASHLCTGDASALSTALPLLVLALLLPHLTLLSLGLQGCWFLPLARCRMVGRPPSQLLHLLLFQSM
jgi:hypothetical protein